MEEKFQMPEDVAQEWLELREKKMLLEKRIDEIKPILETYLALDPSYEMEMCGHKFKLVNSEREFFKLAEAKKNMDGRILRPYITTTSFNQIRVTFCGEEEGKEGDLE